MTKNFLYHLEHERIKFRDYSLVKQALAGNEKAFEHLICLYKKKVFILGKSFFHNDSDAEDFVQDVFIKVYTKLSSFKGEAMFSTWLMRIAYTSAVTSYKKQAEYQAIDDDSIIPDSKIKTPEELQILKITKEAVREAIKELPPKYAVCIEMYFSYNISYQEISEITDFPVNTIKSHVFRAKKILKTKLEALYEK
ncbi:MAG: sigma-70 family RNA polymerase sigma factor [Treponema sp.]|nr:sigma-70 family RNA polymerase sigma factor [Treponema sp.]